MAQFSIAFVFFHQINTWTLAGPELNPTQELPKSPSCAFVIFLLWICYICLIQLREDRYLCEN